MQNSMTISPQLKISRRSVGGTPTTRKQAKWGQDTAITCHYLRGSALLHIPVNSTIHYIIIEQYYETLNYS